MKRGITSLALVYTTAGCAPAERADWQQIENYGESALFVDVNSVEREGPLATYWIKLDEPSWLGRQFGKNEVRTKEEINCTSKVLRSVAGGVYVNGRLRYPYEKLSAGKIGPTGYGKLLYDRVC